MVDDQIKKDHVFTLVIKEELQIIAVGFSPSKLCKAKNSN